VRVSSTNYKHQCYCICKYSQERDIREHYEIAGIDGCAAGWIIATPDEVFVARTLDLRRFTYVGIDMPIGLVDGPPRACDREARKYLAAAGSSVFPAPPRAALTCTDYPSALATARSATGRGISKQTFNIMRKVAELDELIEPRHEDTVAEVHPECTFKMLNDDQPLPSKKTHEGRAIRRGLLSEHFHIPDKSPPGAAIDDLLDAYAVLWSVTRFRHNDHRVFGDGSRDPRGIQMRIIC
jgi:predicted RNase H-like nuclease